MTPILTPAAYAEANQRARRLLDRAEAEEVRAAGAAWRARVFGPVDAALEEGYALLEGLALRRALERRLAPMLTLTPDEWAKRVR